MLSRTRTIVALSLLSGTTSAQVPARPGSDGGAPEPAFYATLRRWITVTEQRLARPSPSDAVRVVVGPLHRVRGALPLPVLRRGLERHLNELVHCADQGLQAHPAQRGYVLVAFVIGSAGTVYSSTVVDTSLPDPAVAQCMAAAFRRWTFPAPADGQLAFVVVPLVVPTFVERRRDNFDVVRPPRGHGYGH